jgi:drug/metabolite transporter (DMT)-like permease
VSARLTGLTDERKGELAILVAALLFGSTFVVMKSAIEEAEPVPFISARFLIAAAVLMPLALRRPATPRLLRDSTWAALALGAGYVFQTVGLQYTTGSVSAFVTYLFVVIVPVMSALFLKHLPAPATIAGLVVATVGLVLLTGGAGSLGRGELLTLGCAISFAAHVIVLSVVSPRHDTWQLTALQLGLVGAALLVPGWVVGGYDFGIEAWLAAAYTAVAASAIALGAQIWGQRLIGPTRTSLLLMVEPVSAAFLGYVVGDRLGITGVIGALLILGGIALAEFLPARTPRPAAVGD